MPCGIELCNRRPYHPDDRNAAAMLMVAEWLTTTRLPAVRRNEEAYVMVEVFTPTGIMSTNGSHAARLEALQGKKIGLLSNGNWQAERMLTALQDLLHTSFSNANAALIPANSAIQDDKTIDAIVNQGYDAVIVGSAA